MPSGFLDRNVSRFQFARPAVDWSFLLQISLMPPADSAIEAIRPAVTFWSRSWRKEDARVCFVVSKALRRDLSALEGLLGGDLRGEIDGETEVSSDRGKSLRGEDSFLGEYWSFQSLTTSALQKASILGL